MKNRKKKRNFFQKKIFGVEKSKFANRLKRALPKFRGDRSGGRGVNGRSKFVAASAGRAERKQCAGVPPPAWLDPAFLEVWGRRPYREGFAGPAEGHRRPSNFFILGAKLAPSSFFCAICLYFFRAMFRSCFFIVSRWFLNGFWEVWGRFWGCFGDGFSHDFQKNKFLKK